MSRPVATDLSLISPAAVAAAVHPPRSVALDASPEWWRHCWPNPRIRQSQTGSSWPILYEFLKRSGEDVSRGDLADHDALDHDRNLLAGHENLAG